LESVCWGNSTVGSNPTLSATQSACAASVKRIELKPLFSGHFRDYSSRITFSMSHPEVKSLDWVPNSLLPTRHVRSNNSPVAGIAEAERILAQCRK
jgi:hypothetical protein